MQIRGGRQKQGMTHTKQGEKVQRPEAKIKAEKEVCVQVVDGGKVSGCELQLTAAQ